MEKMKDLKDLLTHEIQDLYSAEEQIIEAMPMMIEKTKNAALKKALEEHLRITEEQKNRLDEVKRMLRASESELPGVEGESNGAENAERQEEKRGFLSGLFRGEGTQKCKGMQGLIEEGQKIMKEDIDPEVLDAAIIASAQKIEHYEICGYGTARAFARELNLMEIAELLEETLDEEYTADDLLTDLAVGGLNERAEGRRPRRPGAAGNSGGFRGGRSAKKNAPGSKSKAARKAAPRATKKSAPKAGKKAAPSKKSAPKKATPKKAAAKKSGVGKGGTKSSGKGGKTGGRGVNKSSRSASTRSVQSPGGRAGTSHRGPRGH